METNRENTTTDTNKKNKVPKRVVQNSATLKKQSGSEISNTTGDTGPSENTAPSPKRVNKKKTPETAKLLAPTKKSAGARQSALAGALENPVPINAIGNLPKSLVKQFFIESPTDRIPERRSSHGSTHEKKSSLKSLILEMGFHEKNPQYKKCGKTL